MFDVEFAMARDYDDQDAFWNGGGNLRIEPEPAGQHFEAFDYFFQRPRAEHD